MRLKLQQGEVFREDFALRARWYVREAGGAVALRYQKAVDATLELLCGQPGLGRKRRFRHPSLQGLQSFQVQRPFNRLLIFYRASDDVLHAVRLMHGARDLSRRLSEPPVPNAT